MVGDGRNSRLLTRVGVEMREISSGENVPKLYPWLWGARNSITDGSAIDSLFILLSDPGPC